jgi:hypothetical protein
LQEDNFGWQSGCSLLSSFEIKLMIFSISAR